LGQIEHLIFDWGEHPDRAVTPLAVVEILEVFEDGIGEFDAGPPALSIQELGTGTSRARNSHNLIMEFSEVVNVAMKTFGLDSFSGRHP
jgi:hypothetical protein